jgi:hypothetical protein
VKDLQSIGYSITLYLEKDERRKSVMKKRKIKVREEEEKNDGEK